MAAAHLSIELVDDEMTESGFEEVLLGAVFQQRVVHRVGSDLDNVHTMQNWSQTPEIRNTRLV